MMRWARPLLLASVVALLAVGCSRGNDDGSSTTTTDEGVTITVSLLDTMSFEPSSITVAPGDEVTVILSNKGTLPHNFTIEGLGVSVDVAPGETSETTFTAPTSPGEHKIYCNVLGHEGAGMVGSFTVQK